LVLKCIDHVNTPVMKADLWRYMILWEYGGLFADLDVLPSLSPRFNALQLFDETPDVNAFFVLDSSLSSQGVATQWYMAAAPGHTLIRTTLETALQLTLKAKRADPLMTTGPRALVWATDEFLNWAPHRRKLQVNQTYYQGGVINGTVDMDSFRLLSKEVAHNKHKSPAKLKSYRSMNMTHYKAKRTGNFGGKGRTCLDFLGGTYFADDKTIFYQGKNLTVKTGR